MIRQRYLPLTLLASCALMFWGCPDDDDDGGNDASTDTGPRDTGMADTGADTGPRDTGPDTGVDTGVDSGADNCAPNETIDVNGTSVTVDEATEPPVTGGSTEAVLSCRVPPDPPFANPYCLVECVEFFGYDPSPAEVQQLEVAAWPLLDIGTMTPIDSDPRYDRATGIDLDPDNRVDIGFIFTSPPNTECASGWQLELAYLGGPGSGSELLQAETPYVLRIRAVQTATPAWADMYHYGFIRRNDETSGAPACGLNEARVPGIRYTFPIVHRSLLTQAIAAAGAAIPGAANLDDGLGSGYALLEARDCSSGGGVAMENATFGSVPAAIADLYPGAPFDLNRNNLFTDETGHWLTIGFEEMTATSSTAFEVTGAAGVSSDGTCTEPFAGSSFSVYPDGVTFFRLNRENAIVD